jgi:GT2 family glycosyltransferase
MSARQVSLLGAGDGQCAGKVSIVRPRRSRAVVQAERPRVDGLFFARGQMRFQVRGVTYGPFAPADGGLPFPVREQVADDFRRMRAAGINSLRTYHPPPSWLLALAEDHGLSVLVDVPWRKHLCFLDSREARQEARQAVRLAAEHGRRHRSVLAYSVGNEIPPEVVRWHGARRVERFLAELADVAKQADPDGLVTYANYPPTEYLELKFLDFATFNVYLHDREAFRRYLFRLQNLVGQRPLLLGELGMDCHRHGELGQAKFLAGHLAEARLMGLAGAFVFSWTDDWFTGGHRIEDWAFGITRADRSPKAAYHAVHEIMEGRTAELLRSTPRVTVVVCSFNGGKTLDQCLRSLLELDYPDYEIILVDDGSTDDTRDIAARYPKVRAIHQANFGLSAARNVGMRAATGEVVAYTDSDCFADKDWLTHFVYQLQRSRAAAVGGPNLTPEDGWLAACVAASPGQPTHVLESDQVAEHIPGCNMAFRREALLAINGFDVQYRRAGDDVDVCWRLQQAGMWITFAPGAFVWHHRRQAPRAYLRQQSGYGEAEALLLFQHPARFNHRGEGKWRGTLYGAALQGLRLGAAIVYRGTFGTALFQCLYKPATAHWAMLPCTLEWHVAAALMALAGLFRPAALWISAIMLILPAFVALLQASQAQLAPAHRCLSARLLIAALCYAQPLVRSWKRYRTRLFTPRTPAKHPSSSAEQAPRFPIGGGKAMAYWGDRSQERTQLLNKVVSHLESLRWAKVIDAGWSEWDLTVDCTRWSVVQVCTAQEDHGAGKRLIRVRYRLRPRGATRALALAGTAGVVGVALASPAAGAAASILFPAACLGAWWRGLRPAAEVARVFDAVAASMGLVACHAAPAKPVPEME